MRKHDMPWPTFRSAEGWASIERLHANASSSRETDWHEIAALYGELEELSSNPVVTLNRAVALALSDGLEQGLAIMNGLAKSEPLAEYYLLPAARADLLRRLGRDRDALSAYQRALSLAANDIERNYLSRRIAQVSPERPS